MKAIRIVLLLSTVVLISACAQNLTLKELTVLDADNQSEAAQGPRLELKVEGKPPKLVFVTPNDPGCKGKGCLVSGEKQLVVARFRLSSSPGWAFSRFKLCKGTEKNALDCELTVWSRLEFGVGTSINDDIISPDRNGMVDLRKVSDGSPVTLFRVANLNSLRADYFYRVQVCPVTESGTDYDSGACIWDEDPPWRNRGRR